MKSEVLIATQCFYPDAGGIENFMTGLADHCALVGYTVTVIAERIRGNLPAPPRPKPYTVVRFGGPRPWRRWRKRAAIAGILRERGSQIAGIFADSWKSMEALPSGLDVPVSVFAHGMEYPLDASPAKTRRISSRLGAGRRRAAEFGLYGGACPSLSRRAGGQDANDPSALPGVG